MQDFFWILDLCHFWGIKRRNGRRETFHRHKNLLKSWWEFLNWVANARSSLLTRHSLQTREKLFFGHFQRKKWFEMMNCPRAVKEIILHFMKIIRMILTFLFVKIQNVTNLKFMRADKPSFLSQFECLKPFIPSLFYSVSTTSIHLVSLGSCFFSVSGACIVSSVRLLDWYCWSLVWGREENIVRGRNNI